ncbi:hypothetical protein C8C77_11513 [Halanaerobium saccharolyticum]|uniref:Uncharacterized protein n=1 Tax=Halanaerobium saccharolyticum TaxID=43595 RepID=A0A4R7Z483_9FIRM|nr:hypothetical protein [Halanaerobium saccharolyticum]RAK08989.1 hypothetical protein C7958_108110 [Halanaerobium saccharolyticum]TDW02617.1 hypothetical protein C8C77_11513 [Halanaerobium saccharolyticum]TDX60752.1 hypothetical protein C7956_108110 [Halanaerobium saccharolyticum]
MVETIDCYHGTLKINAQSIIEGQNILPSTGDRHWLGDGVYFFERDFWAYWWIRELYLNKLDPLYNNIYELDLDENYKIIKATLNFNSSCKFNLDIIEHKDEFETAKELMIEKGELDPDIDSDKIVDGVVINYMFDVLFYDGLFDLVKATFERKDEYKKMFETRFGCKIKHSQICIKNTSVINNLRKFDYFSRLSRYYNLLNRWFPKHRFYKNNIYYLNRKKIYN